MEFDGANYLFRARRNHPSAVQSGLREPFDSRFGRPGTYTGSKAIILLTMAVFIAAVRQSLFALLLVCVAILGLFQARRRYGPAARKDKPQGPLWASRPLARRDSKSGDALCCASVAE